MKRLSKNARLTTRGSAIGILALVGIVGAGPAFAEPRTESPVAQLVNQIAEVDQNLSDLTSQVAIKQENVNRTLVDFQNAIAAQQAAAAADNTARKSLSQADELVEAAQRDFDEFMRTVNRQGNNLGSMTQYLAADDPEKVLEKLTSVDQVTQQQRRTIKKLQVVRNQQANKVAATSATRRQTEIAAQGATERRSAAVSAVEEAREALQSQSSKRTALVEEREKLTQRLAALKKSGTKTSGTGTTAEQIDKLLRSVPTNPVAGDDALAQAAEAAAVLALDVGQKLLAELIGQQQIPQSELFDELGVTGSSPFGSGPDSLLSRLGNGSLGALFGGNGGLMNPGLRGPQAVELIINRAKSQMGVPYAWGGGDANGPTLGIRDGGVADAHGDYNKVGFDCSGLMIYAFAGVGIELPHYTGYQYTSGPQVPLSEMQRGDMIFYGPSASEHVALYLGNNEMIEAPQSGDVVKISPLRTAGAMPMVVRLV